LSAARRALVAVVVLVAAGSAVADRLHLQGGGVLDADRWWFEGDTLRIESRNGSVGIPRSMLVRVESSTAAQSATAPTQRAPAATSPTGAVRVDSEGREALAAASAALAARDFETAVIRFHDVIRLEPRAAGARVGYAIAEMALGRDQAALPVVLDGLALDPQVAQLHEVLGDLRDRDERVEDALVSWREAFRLAPGDRLRDKIIKGERELAAARDYSFSAAAHFNMRYEGALDQDLVASLTDYLEDRYQEFASIYRHAPSQAITVLLYPQQTFHDVTQVGNEVAGLYDGKIRVPLGGLKRVDADAARVLSHELTHAFVQSKTRGNCPRWLHEGLAQIAEPRTLRRSQLAELAGSVRADAPGTWPDAAFSYPAALGLTRFLEERRGFDVLVAVLGRLGDGDGLDTALQAYYGATYAELASAWAASLRTDGTQ